MSKISSFILAASLVLLPLAGPARGQNATSSYGTGEPVLISGWEKNLVQKHKGLNHFHWAPISTVRRYQAVQAPRQQDNSAQVAQCPPESRHIYTRPNVISTWAPSSKSDHRQQAMQQEKATESGAGRQTAHSRYQAAAAATAHTIEYEQQPALSQGGTLQYGEYKSSMRQLAHRVKHY